MSDRSCEFCKHYMKRSNQEPCDNCCRSYPNEFEPMTNADGIRAMSDEELADFIFDIQVMEENTKYGQLLRGDRLRWLQSEAESVEECKRKNK